MKRRAVFLDRDGVVVPDRGVEHALEALEPAAAVVDALARLRRADFALVLVTNQTAVARGLAREAEIHAVHRDLCARLAASGAALDAVKMCPHHPHAEMAAYRVECECRKPRPGMLLTAAAALEIDPARSFMIGDRPSDVAAGRRAGCSSILLTSGGCCEAPPIVSPEPYEADSEPDATCKDLADAADWILSGSGR